MKQAILGILRDIFTSSGYDVTESYTSDLIATRSEQTAIIRFEALPDHESIRELADQASNETGLYVTTGSIEEDLQQYANDMGIVVWDRDEIAVQIGKAVIADIEGTTGQLELIKPAVQSAQPKEESLYGMFRKNSVQENVQPTSAWDDLPAQQVAPQTWNANTVTLHATPVKTSKDQALAIAKPHIGIVKDAVLKFVPFWRYIYSVNSENRYKSKIIDISGNGAGCINALNGNNEALVLDEIQDQIEVPEENYDVKMQMVTKEEAHKSLIDMILKEHTRDIRFDNTIGDAIVSEHKLFKPAMDEIKLDMEMVYVPIWEVKGARNSIEINGYSSEILSEPVDDDVEFV